MAKQSKDISPEQLVIGRSIFEFGLDLYKAVAGHFPSSRNLLMSPYNVSAGLALTMLGTETKSESQLTAALKLTGIPKKTLHKGYRDLKKLLNSIKGIFILLKSANTIFLRTGAELKSNYTSETMKFYGTKPKILNFLGRLQKSRRAMDKYMENKTDKKITNFTTANSPGPKGFIVLANALYLNGDWRRKFKDEKTTRKDFFVSKTEKVETEMMHMGKDKWLIGVVEEFDCKVLEIPYRDKRLSMIMILPNGIDGLANLEHKLTAEILHTMLSSVKSRDTVVSIPKFKMEGKNELQDILPKLGISDIFDDKKSDFNKMLQQKGARVSDVIHTAVIEVEERGSEAPAGPSDKASENTESDLLKFEANHPFLFLVKENSTGMILFIGRYCQPQPPDYEFPV